MSRTWKRILVIAGAVVLVGVIAAAIILGPFLYAIWRYPHDDAKFSRSKWLTESSWKSDNPRGPMAEDLRSKYLHVGMPKKNVRQLLGKSDNSQYDESQKNVDRYLLGNWGFMSIDGDYLIIHYDKAGRLKSTEIYSH